MPGDLETQSRERAPTDRHGRAAAPALPSWCPGAHNRHLLTGYGSDYLTTAGTVADAIGSVSRSGREAV